ncbi:MAG: hypothetical protein MJ025_00795 [Victivallaceae bacterium]|nr:hypothetical protein [Victivallaceae bacterium]
MKYIRMLFLVAALTFVFTPRAEAFDPITLAVLAPMAIKMAQKSAPYLARVGVSFVGGLTKIFKDVIEVLRLPYGLLVMLFASPFGGFKHGLRNTIKGAVAPVKLVVHTVLLPFYTVGGISNF